MADLKEIAKSVFLRTLAALDPAAVINQKLELDGQTLTFGENRIALDAYREVVLIGMGKASLTMGAAVEALLGDRIKRGILVTDRRSHIRVRSEIVVGGHPLPDENSLIAGAKILDLVRSCDARSLLVFLISGGGSSLVESPLSSEISLADLRATNGVLTRCGAPIHEINLIRKSLSRIKGGRLGQFAANSSSVALYISDVNPGDLRSIASNPVLAEEINPAKILEVMSRFDLMNQLPASVTRAIRNVGSTPAPGAGRPNEPATLLLMENSSAVGTAATLAIQSGFRVEVDADLIEGDYKTVADQSIDHLMKLKTSFPNEKVCVISGGEVSCGVRGNGIGGRNQEFVLYCAAQLARSGIRAQTAVLSGGTDGIDGNSKAAGAVADPELVIKAAQHDVDVSIFISNNDSHSFFRKVGGLVMTGPTGNNVRDLRILMAQ